MSKSLTDHSGNVQADDDALLVHASVSGRQRAVSSMKVTDKLTLPVSVIVPAYGHADYILASLESVLSLPVPPREVIVINDSSPDDTELRLGQLIRDNRIKYVKQANAGMAAARNVGAGLATSPYLYFLDDDDLMYPNAMPWMVEELEQHPEAAMAFGDMIIFEDQPLPEPISWSDTRTVDILPFLLFNQLGSPGQVLIRRSSFLEAGGFDAKIWGTDDWDLWLRLLKRYAARSARRPVVAYRLHANNASRNVARMFMSSLRVARRHLKEIPFADRVVLRRYTYFRLKQYHVPRLVVMFSERVRARQWSLARQAATAWTVSMATEFSARVMLKLYLTTKGRWYLPTNHPLARVIVRHCGGV